MWVYFLDKSASNEYMRKWRMYFIEYTGRKFINIEHYQGRRHGDGKVGGRPTQSFSKKEREKPKKENLERKKKRGKIRENEEK